MVQLLRVLNNQTGPQEFQINLKDNIRLKKDAKIALKNINFILDSTVVIPSGITLTWNIQGTNKIVSIPPGDYNTQQLSDMLNIALNSGLNFVLDIDANDKGLDSNIGNAISVFNGFAWRIFVENSKLNIGWNRAEVGVVSYFNNAGGDASQWLNFNQSITPMCPGCFGFQILIASNAEVISASEFIVGITNKTQTANVGTGISPANIYCGAKLSPAATSYSLVANGETITDGLLLNKDDPEIFPVGNNNTFVFYYDQGAIKFQAFRAMGAVRSSRVYTLLQAADLNTDLYPCYSVKSGAITFGTSLYTPNIEISQTEDGGLHRETPPINMQSNNHALGALSGINVSINMQNAAAYLGYPDGIFTYPNGIKGLYTAVEQLISDQLNSSIVVEIPTLPLKSYDSATGSRRSIVSVIDSLDSLAVGGNRKKYSHTEDTLIFLDIDNPTETIINNLFIRVLISGATNAILSTDGLTEMTLVFD
jgi:hypothetical protein